MDYLLFLIKKHNNKTAGYNDIAYTPHAVLYMGYSITESLANTEKYK